MTLLTEDQLGEVIDDNYREPGDQLFRKEGLAWYDVPSQNADREAWLDNRFDPAQVQAWAEILEADKRRGLVSQRLRIVSAQITDDEAMSLEGALPLIAGPQEVRILRRGEHPIPDIVDHDYFVIRRAAGVVIVIAMHYSSGGAFLGAEVVAADQHSPYLREMELAWAIAQPYADWWAAHPELHRRAAA